MDKWIERFRKERQDYGVSQERLSVYAGISREYLSRLENGKVKVTESMKEKLNEALGKLKPDAPLFLLIDYVRIRFPTTDVRYVVEELMRIKMKYMGHEDYGFYSYPEHYYIGDIFVLASPDEKKASSWS